MKKRLRWVLIAFWSMGLLAELPALTLWGVDINGLEIETGYLIIQNSVDDSAPAPIVNSVGLSVPFRFLTSYTFRPEAQVFTQAYAFQNDRAVPMETMFDHVSVLSLLLNANVGMEFPLNPALSVFGELGMSFINRFPIFLNGKTAGEMALPITGWFLAGRFLYPNFSAGMAWQFSPLFALTLRSQFYYPIFNLWQNLPWWDEMTVGLNLGVRFTF